jgi:hypothetical protein
MVAARAAAAAAPGRGGCPTPLPLPLRRAPVPALCRPATVHRIGTTARPDRRSCGRVRALPDDSSEQQKANAEGADAAAGAPAPLAIGSSSGAGAALSAEAAAGDIEGPSTDLGVIYDRLVRVSCPARPS